MKVNEKGKDLIKSLEGCKLKAYQCSAGKWTIGYGFTRGVKEGDTITQEEADKRFEDEVQNFANEVSLRLRVPVNENQFSAMVSLVYNIGVGAFEHSTLLRFVNRMFFEEAANEFPKWNKSGGKPLAGLTRRREAERALFLEPVEGGQGNA